MSRALIQGTVHLCRSNTSGVIVKKWKKWFVKKCQIWHFFVFLFHKLTNLTNQCFNFLIISLVIFYLQKHTIHQIKAQDISFWPCVIIFSLRINICWAILSRSCAIFFCSDFSIEWTHKKVTTVSGIARNSTTKLTLRKNAANVKIAIVRISLLEILLNWIYLNDHIFI